MLKLFHNDMSVCAQKVRMVLAAKEAQWEGEHLNLRAGDQHKPEFIALSPKALVPVLVHDDQVILESSVIVEYLEELFPEKPLFPASLAERAKVRWWLLGLDAGLHVHVAAISFCLAFRYQVLEKYPDEADLKAFINNTPDPARLAALQDMIFNGKDSVRLKFAVLAYSKLLSDMGKTLKESDYLVGNSMTAADVGYIPYLDRLDQLGLSRWWQDKPQIDAWLERVRASSAYVKGIEEWKNPKYLGMMASLSEESWGIISDLL